MSLYWPEFEFNFRLDIQGLLPHIAAIEAYKGAALSGVHPPQWREQTGEEAQTTPSDLTPEQRARMDPIDIRKQELLLRNANRTGAWVRERFVPGSPPLSMDDILAMHRMVAEETGVLYNNPGVLRTTGVRVGRREVGGLHLGAPSEKLPLLMGQYIEFINSEQMHGLPPVIHALVAHFFFTTIHPFDDGNGRLCRLVSAAVLFQRGYNVNGSYALTRYFYQNGIRYHTLLHRCWQEPLPFDLTAFVAFGMEGLAIELRGINSFMKMKLNRIVERESLDDGK